MRAKITMRTSLDKKYIMAESYAKNPEESTAFGILKRSQKTQVGFMFMGFKEQIFESRFVITVCGFSNRDPDT